MPPKANHRRRRPPRTATRDANGPTPRPGQTSSEPQNPRSSDQAGNNLNELPPTDSSSSCPVCASEVIDAAVGTCGHAVCAPCSHKLRYLYKRRTCVLCNVSNELVVVLPFEDYVASETTPESVRTARIAAGLPPLLHDHDTDMYYVHARVMKRQQLIAGFTCPLYVADLIRKEWADQTQHEHLQAAPPANEPPDADHEPTGLLKGDASIALPAADQDVCRAPRHRNRNGLRTHVREQHRAVFCDVCYESKKEYLSMLPIYPMDSGNRSKQPTALQKHFSQDHPRCQFCSLHVLDDDELFHHLQKNHEICHLCERAGRLHEYYRNYAALEAHYRASHFVCEDQGCRGVVFATRVDLQAHELQRHRPDIPRNSRARRLHVDLSELHAAHTGAANFGNMSSPDTGSAADVRLEQERQAARRRGFLASRVIYSAGEGTSQTEASFGSSSASVGNTPSRPDGAFMNPLSSSSNISRPSAADRMSRRPADHVPRTDTSGSAENDFGEYYFCERELPASPEESALRNRAIINTIRENLDPADFEQFRAVSGDFRQRRIGAEEYYDAVVDTFGVRASVRSVLPELAALLPNEDQRNELLNICRARNHVRTAPAPSHQDSNNMGSTASSAHRHAPSSNGLNSREEFPTLPGASSTPSVSLRPSPIPARNFSRPRSDDFPSLPSTNRSDSMNARQAGRSGQDRSPEQSGSHHSTTAQVLMRPNVQAMMGNNTVRSVRSGGNAGPVLTVDAFPQLAGRGVDPPTATFPRGRQEVSVSSSGGNSVSMRPAPRNTAESVSLSSQSTNERNLSSASPQTVTHLDPDVSMRVGAVWGGVAARSYTTGDRRPSAARSDTVDTVERPSISESSEDVSSEMFPPLSALGRMSSADDVRSPVVSGNKSTVIDVMALARDKQTKSALPKVSGGGYGFAWDRKKVRAKQREVKASLGSSSSSAEGKLDPDGRVGGASRSSGARSSQNITGDVPVMDGLQIQTTSAQSNAYTPTCQTSRAGPSSGELLNMDLNSGFDATVALVDDQCAQLSIGDATQKSEDPTKTFFARS